MIISPSRRKKKEIPIVPLLDILFILLVYILVSMQFKKTRPSIEINLPTSKHVPTNKITKKHYKIIVDKQQKIYFNSDIIPQKKLTLLLKKLSRNQQSHIVLELDKQVTMQTYLFIKDCMQQAGINKTDIPINN